MKPRLLAAFCGVGGCTRGYQQAGFHVTGVDIADQPRYCGDDFVRGDAIDFIKAHGHEYTLIHAGPPCQHDCTLTAGTNAGKFTYPDLMADTRAALESTNRPYVIENPPGRAAKKMRVDLTLCGEQFGLRVIRHRNFELGGWTAPQPAGPPGPGGAGRRGRAPARRAAMAGWGWGVVSRFTCQALAAVAGLLILARRPTKTTPERGNR